jgi:hypothetical protein
MIDPLAMFYLWLAVLALAISFAALSAPLIIASSAMLVSWAVSNVAVEILGFARAPLIIAPADLMIGIGLSLVALDLWDRRLMIVGALFGYEMVWTIGAWLFHAWASWPYVAGLNAIFVLQVLTIGAGGVVQGLGVWSSCRRRARHHRGSLGTGAVARVEGEGAES